MEMVNGKVTFPAREGFGPQVLDETVSFSSNVKSFTVGLKGFELRFDDEDHHIHLANVDVQGKKKNDTTIEVTCTLALRDHSGDWNDKYSGYVSYAVLAEIEKIEPPKTLKFSGFIYSIKSAELGENGEDSQRSLLVQLYVPIKEKLIDLIFNPSDIKPEELILTALLRDALALSLPVTCDVIQSGERFNIVNLEIKTRRIYHQAGWIVSNGKLQATTDKLIDTVKGKVTLVSVGAYGLLKETNNDLPDIAFIILTDEEGKEIELLLGLQRADLNTNLSILTMLFESYRESSEVTISYYLEPLYHTDIKKVKWIQSVQFWKQTSLTPGGP